MILNKENKFRAAITTYKSEINSLQINNISAVNHRYLFKGREKINPQVCPYLFQLLFTRRLSVAPSFVPSPRFLDTEYLAFTAEVRLQLHVSVVRTFGTDGCVNYRSIGLISWVDIRWRVCGVASADPVRAS